MHYTECWVYINPLRPQGSYWTNYCSLHWPLSTGSEAVLYLLEAKHYLFILQRLIICCLFKLVANEEAKWGRESFPYFSPDKRELLKENLSFYRALLIHEPNKTGWLPQIVLSKLCVLEKAFQPREGKRVLLISLHFNR